MSESEPHKLVPNDTRTWLALYRENAGLTERNAALTKRCDLLEKVAVAAAAFDEAACDSWDALTDALAEVVIEGAYP